MWVVARIGEVEARHSSYVLLTRLEAIPGQRFVQRGDDLGRQSRQDQRDQSGHCPLGQQPSRGFVASQEEAPALAPQLIYDRGGDPLPLGQMPSRVLAETPRNLGQGELRPCPQRVECWIDHEELAVLPHLVVVVTGIAISQ